MVPARQFLLYITLVCVPLTAILAGCGAVHPLLNGGGPKTNFDRNITQSSKVIDAFNAFVSTGACNKTAKQKAGGDLLDAYYGGTRNPYFPDLVVAYASIAGAPAAVINLNDKPARVLSNESNLWVLIFSTFAFNGRYEKIDDTITYVSCEGLAYQQSGGFADVIASVLTQKPTGNILPAQQTISINEAPIKCYPGPEPFKYEVNGKNDLYLYTYKIDLEKDSIYRASVLPQDEHVTGYEYHFANIKLSMFGLGLGVGAVNGSGLNAYLCLHLYASQLLTQVRWDNFFTFHWSGLSTDNDDWKWNRWLALVLGVNLQQSSSDIIGVRFTPYTNEWKDKSAGSFGLIVGKNYDWSQPLGRWPLFFGVDYKL